MLFIIYFPSRNSYLIMKTFGEGSPMLFFFFSKACRSAAGGEGLKHFFKAAWKNSAKLMVALVFFEGNEGGNAEQI